MRRRDPWTCPECKGKIRKRPGRPPRKCDDCKGELEQKRPRVNTGYQGEPPVPPPPFFGDAIAQLEQFVRRGQRAQAAIDALLADGEG